MRSVINNLPALIAYVDADQRYVYANAQYQVRFAPGRDAITGCTVRDILGDALYATVAPMIADVLRGNPRSYDWQPFPGAWQLVSYVPKHDEQRRVLGYYVLILPSASMLKKRSSCSTAIWSSMSATWSARAVH